MMIPAMAALALAAGVFAGTPEDKHPPTGYLDLADGHGISGWARDDDFDGPIVVHIYVDGRMVQRLAAGHTRSDIGAHGFSWLHEPFGAGNHVVQVYAIGVNSAGAPTGVNAELGGSPAKPFSTGCSGLPNEDGQAGEWCRNNPAYWVHRQGDTAYINGANEKVRIGVNRSYNGTIYQLFGFDWTRNLLLEHGGGALQLSLWGYEQGKGGDGWFGRGGKCDPVAYQAKEACMAAGYDKDHCFARAWSKGAQVADCKTVTPCNGWEAGAPWNFIQAQAANCLWDSPTNDATQFDAQPQSITALVTKTNMFTKSRDPMPGLSVAETVTIGDLYAEVDYAIDYRGTHSMGYSDQEIPAIFTATGMDDTFWYATKDGIKTLRRSDVLNSRQITDLAEKWVSVCDASGERCLTIAADSKYLKGVNVQSIVGGGHMTPIGYFALTPGFHEDVKTFLFPFRFDHTEDGASVRQRINRLAPPRGASGAPPTVTKDPLKIPIPLTF